MPARLSFIWTVISGQQVVHGTSCVWYIFMKQAHVFPLWPAILPSNHSLMTSQWYLINESDDLSLQLKFAWRLGLISISISGLAQPLFRTWCPLTYWYWFLSLKWTMEKIVTFLRNIITAMLWSNINIQLLLKLAEKGS